MKYEINNSEEAYKVYSYFLDEERKEKMRKCNHYYTTYSGHNDNYEMCVFCRHIKD